MRPSKPTALHLHQGTYRKDRHGTLTDYPHPAPGIPSCPPFLSDGAKKEWRRLAKKLYALGILTPLDRTALAVYCQCWARWSDAQEKLKTEGLTQTTPNGYEVPSVWLTVANQAQAEMRRFGQELGLTPVSRARVKVKASPHPQPKSKLLEFIQGWQSGSYDSTESPSQPHEE